MSIFAFSLMSPLGIFIGWISTETADESKVSGVCTALAAGTFLFVGVMEIIPQELQEKRYQGAKSLALAAGFLTFGILAKWT